MNKKVFHVNKGKICKPKNENYICHVSSVFENITMNSGRCENFTETDAGYATRWINENHI